MGDSLGLSSWVEEVRFSGMGKARKRFGEEVKSWLWAGLQLPGEMAKTVTEWPSLPPSM